MGYHQRQPRHAQDGEAGGSRSPFDHVRMAIEKAAASSKRRDSIESFARGALKNWVREGFPAINAPSAPGLAKPHPNPEADRLAAVEKRRAEAQAEAAANALKARWEAIPQTTKERAFAEFERENPRPSDRGALSLWELLKRTWCREEWLKSQN